MLNAVNLEAFQSLQTGNVWLHPVPINGSLSVENGKIVPAAGTAIEAIFPAPVAQVQFVVERNGTGEPSVTYDAGTFKNQEGEISPSGSGSISTAPKNRINRCVFQNCNLLSMSTETL